MIDVERVFSADNGALRIQPLLRAGWGRAVLALGPVSSAPGLALAVFMLHGHNTSQAERLPERLADRLRQWAAGPGTERLRQRLLPWLQSGRVRRTFRQFRWWYALSRPHGQVPLLDENFSLCWSAYPDGVPLVDGHGLVMHATGPENGELWLGASGRMMPALRGVQNIPLYFVIVIRPTSVLCLASSVPGAHGPGAYPWMRPVAVSPGAPAGPVHAVLQQSVLGQIGFRLDSRVYGIRVAQLPEFESWYGGSHSADALAGRGPLAEAPAECGEGWVVEGARLSRTTAGARADGEALAWMPAGESTGIVSAIAEAEEPSGFVGGLIWRRLDEVNHWRFEVSAETDRLVRTVGGRPHVVAESARGARADGHLQILDDGLHIAVLRDESLVFGRRFRDASLGDATGIGFLLTSGTVRDFEALPRALRLPPVLDMGVPWLELGGDVAVTDDFQGAESDLHDREIGSGLRWQREVGQGAIDVTGAGTAKVRASRAKPSPRRTLYLHDWTDPAFADLEVSITPPGTGRGEGEHGSAGLVFWQDPENYFIVNIWVSDSYQGASLSTFFRVRGFEDLYDAVWSNVGDRVYWGRPARLRVVSTGERFAVIVDDEPVLVRSFTDVYPDCAPMRIRKVGLAVNWEWGEDTGSEFHAYRARRRRAGE